jgi:hypothetical protein
MISTLLTPSYNRQHVKPEHKRNNSNQNADNLRTAACHAFSFRCKQQIYMWIGSVFTYATAILILSTCMKHRWVSIRSNGTVAPFHAMNAYREVEVQLHSLLNLAADGGERSRSSPGEQPQYPMNRRLGGLQSKSGRFGLKNLLNATGSRTPDRPVRSLVTILTELSPPYQETSHMWLLRFSEE